MTEKSVFHVQGHEIIVESTEDALFIHLDGCGTFAEIDGWPIRLDYFYDDLPTLYVWSDINEEESTHVISMAGALESKLNDTQ